MPSYQIDRPIPGQSLTDEPRNAPYERAPEIVDPEEALQAHLIRLNNPDAIEELMFFLELGVDIRTLTEGILRNAVINGIHTIDVSLIIAPVIHQFIKSAADELKVSYDEGFEDTDRSEVMYQRRKAIALKKLKELKMEPETEMVAMNQPVEMAPEENTDQMELDLGETPAAPAEKPKAGLMSRGDI